MSCSAAYGVMHFSFQRASDNMPHESSESKLKAEGRGAEQARRLRLGTITKHRETD